MALSGLDIYKLLPKTNCRKCGFPTCLAFAMQLAKKAISIEKCPYISEEAKKILQDSSLPPIKLICIGEGENKLEIGNETVMFRHEEKFHNPCGVGIIIEDNLTDSQIKERIEKINVLRFERIGQKLEVNLIALRQNGSPARFTEALEVVLANTNLGLVLMSNDQKVIEQALQLSAKRSPLIYRAEKNNFSELAKIASVYNASLVVYASDLEGLSDLTGELDKQQFSALVLESGEKPVADKIWDLTQARRQALKKSNRRLGYPFIVLAANSDPYAEAMLAATYISKYASIVLMQNIEAWQILSVLTLRQNIYSDPQKPLQIDPKLYTIGQANEKSPILVTTNFSLSYYTVLGEVEASKIPAYILSVDTEGMSVLTAWAAEKFTPEKINDAMLKSDLNKTVAHKKVIIPGYVAVMSGELEEKSGWQVMVGPKEAAGIPSFLKNLSV